MKLRCHGAEQDRRSPGRGGEDWGPTIEAEGRIRRVVVLPPAPGRDPHKGVAHNAKEENVPQELRGTGSEHRAEDKTYQKPSKKNLQKGKDSELCDASELGLALAVESRH